ncbi:hypothetical protein FRC06_001467, partial [Ceratobasidium sp. 370]
MKTNLLDALGISLNYRFERLRELADVDEAIECQARAIQLTPEGDTRRPGYLNNLGLSWWRRFDRSGKLEDLEQAIEYQATAVQLIPEDHIDKPGCLNNIGNSWLGRFGRLGDLADLNRAIACQTQAVQLAPEGYAEIVALLNNLGRSLMRRYTRLGNLADLDKAIELAAQATRLTPENHINYTMFLGGLGDSCFQRFERLGDLADIDRAIECQAKAVQLTPEDHPGRPDLLNCLGTSRLRRFERLGDVADIDNAIECLVTAVELTPGDCPDGLGFLNNLGFSWRRRFERLGELADVDKAIECQARAVQLTPDTDTNKPTYLNNLGCSWSSRFERLGQLTDVDKAIECQTRAVQLTPDDHEYKQTHLNSLGHSWTRRFVKLGGLAAIDKAIEYQAQAVELTPESHPDKPRNLNNLSNSFAFRYMQVGDPADLDKAIEYSAQAVQLTPEGHAKKPSHLYNLGRSWLSRFQLLRERADLESARLSFQRGAEHIVTAPEIQILCARNWASCSALLGLSPLQGYRRAFTLIPHLVWLGMTIQGRYSVLTKISDLAAEAAAWAVSVGFYDLAIEWLEAGRSIVWNQILQLRTPFDDLAAVDPGLATRLKAAASQLEDASSRTAATEASQLAVESQARQHRHVAAQWELLIAEARQLPGLHDFMLPRKAQELKRAATDGPVVIINVHSTRCDALIIFPQHEDVLHIPLDRFSMAKSVESRAQIVSLIGHRGNGDRGVKRHNDRASLRDQLRPLSALWLDVVGPVLNALACTRKLPYNELPHITWCATGALSFLPLHAAGLYDGLSLNAFDLVVSSYTPTLSALIPQGTQGVEVHPGVLAVGQARSQRFSPLPKTVEELAIIKKYAKTTPFQQLDGPLATVNATLTAMEDHSWVHFACHATQNRTNPSHSAFHLHDGDLTLEAITKRAFKDKGLAFLSACQTATGDDDLPDEATHLAAGMLMAGYPSVIATMWSIMDNDAPLIAEGVYAELLQAGKMDHTVAARALHKA